MVEHEQCTECGFDGSGYDDSALLEALKALGPRWQALLATAGDELLVRPEPHVWSAIEYAAHSRDITALHVYGVEQALSGSEPEFEAIAGDDLIQGAALSYRDVGAAEVGEALGAEASRLAELAEEADRNTWSRGITVGGSRVDVRRLLEHALHDSMHHIGDVERGLAQQPP